MPRSIELGRAVLCSPAANLELWLTTLITISPKQDDIDIQQLKPAQLLDFLSSGDVWVCRGHGMHIELLLTLREEPLPQRQLQDLVESILRAPVWEQLKLQPSFSGDGVPEPGLTRLNISYAADSGSPEEQRRHRVFKNVPAADVQTPKSVPTFCLCSVHFRIDILETRQRLKAITKKPKASGRKSRTAQIENRAQDRGEQETSQAKSHDMTPVADTSYTIDNSALVGPPLERKRKRSETNNSIRTMPSPTPRSNHADSMRRRPATSAGLQASTLPTLIASDREEIEGIIDGALRLSVCGSCNNRSKSGLKVKASTFSLGLADIAPALWRPGYLPALSQRAHMLPTISRSLSQVAGVRAKSLSLKNKMTRLTTIAHGFPAEFSTHQDLITEQEAGRLTSSTASRLWLHLQKNITSRSTTTLQAFVAYDSEATANPGSDDMLEEMQQCQMDWHTLRPNLGNDEGAGLLNDEPILREVPWSLAIVDKDLLRERAIEHSDSEHDFEETGDGFVLGPGPAGIKPTVTSPGKTESVHGNPSLYSPLASLDVSSNELTKEEPPNSLGANWIAEGHLSTSSLNSLPILGTTEQAQDDLLFDGCGEPVGN